MAKKDTILQWTLDLPQDIYAQNGFKNSNGNAGNGPTLLRRLIEIENKQQNLFLFRVD